MNYLSNYTEQPFTELLKKCNSFYAFSTEQFKEKRKEGLKYVKVGNGLICDAEKQEELFKGIEFIQEAGIKKDLKENGRSKIIERELNNYECFYTYDYTEVIEALKPYNILEEEIKKTFHTLKINYAEFL